MVPVVTARLTSMAIADRDTASVAARAAALDAADPLAGFRDRFAPLQPGLTYLDGNSLGRPPTASIEAVRALTEQWSSSLIRGWEEGWIELPARIGDRLATGVLGARAGEVLVTDSTTVNLYRLAAAALDARPERRTVVIERSEFPTDRYVLEGLARERHLEIRWVEGDPGEGLATDQVAAGLSDEIALVILSAVNYRSSAIADIRGVTEAARAAGALVLWDLSHAAGAVPVDLEANGVELAVGCTYKYLNGGPGSPAFLYVRRELQSQLRAPIQGWMAQMDQFEMGPAFRRRDGIEGWLVGTPGILGMAALEPAVELVAEAGLAAIRAKSVALSTYAVELLDTWLAPLGCSLGSPRDASRRGGGIAIRHPEARRITVELQARGVITDFRAPDSVRVGMSPLTTSFEDVHHGLATFRDVLDG